ncbi:MFS transporter [Fodinisporobacter ferrooxydans]|uniref:MFS transporter n=1 Tax=Fodinisporobacter ferrooxydans TaxID=2901836 RepID=A0ABY4CGD8_9BACL|nr:MFS transporter [Alicyclobacillaceae bacterium MYW30-H2]
MERLWTRAFILMTMGTLFLFTAFYMLYPTLPLFIKQIGGNQSQVGLSMGVFMLASVILRPIIGGLLDRFGSRPFIVMGLIFFAVAMYLYGWIGGIVTLMALRILHGMSWAASTTSILTATTDMIPSNRRGEGLGWFGMSMTLAMAIGPMLGIWVQQNRSFHTLFLFAVGLSVVAMILTFGAKLPTRQKSGVRRKIEFFDRSILPIAVSIFFLFIAYGGITTFVPLFSDTIHVNSGTFFLIYAVTLVLARPFAGKLSDKYGEAFVIVPSLIITVLALAVLLFSSGLFGLIVSAILYGIGFGSAQPALQAATVRLVPVDRTGVANASFTTATDLGIGLGAMILGVVSQYTSYQIVFTVSAVSVAVSLLLFTFFVKRLLKNKKIRKLHIGSLPLEQDNA